MNVIKSTAVILVGAAFLSACVKSSETAEVPQPVEVETAAVEQVLEATSAHVVPSTDGETRLVLYRTSFAGLAVQPRLLVDGQDAAKCAPGRATTLKVTPGTHTVAGQTLKEKSLTVSIAEGETAYVKCSISIGLLVGGVKLVSVDAAEAAPKVAKLKNN